MIEGNIVRFGHGDILVCPLLKGIMFLELHETMRIGQYADAELSKLGKCLEVKSTTLELRELIKRLSDVTDGKVTSVSIGDVVLDFSENNSKSVEAVVEAMYRAIGISQLGRAC